MNDMGQKPKAERNALLLFFQVVTLPNCLLNTYVYAPRSMLLLMLVRGTYFCSKQWFMERLIASKSPENSELVCMPKRDICIKLPTATPSPGDTVERMSEGGKGSSERLSSGHQTARALMNSGSRISCS